MLSETTVYQNSHLVLFSPPCFLIRIFHNPYNYFIKQIVILIYIIKACNLLLYTFIKGYLMNMEATMILDDIKKDTRLINSVDWDMTPEEAIALHLEWGPLRSQAYYNSRDNDNETVYFVISTWQKVPVVRLVRRRGFDSEELAEFELPDNLEKEFLKGIGKYKGVYAVEDDIKDWLKKELAVN